MAQWEMSTVDLLSDSEAEVVVMHEVLDAIDHLACAFVVAVCDHLLRVAEEGHDDHADAAEAEGDGLLDRLAELFDAVAAVHFFVAHDDALCAG